MGARPVSTTSHDEEAALSQDMSDPARIFIHN